MARVASAPELALLAAAGYKVVAKVEIEDGDFVFRDYRSQGGFNWIVGFTIDHDIDQPVAQATVQLWRQHGSTASTLSLAPTRADSTLNRKADATFAPAIDLGRRVRISTACVALGGTPVSGDWKIMFEGEIDVFQFEQATMTITARDDGARLVDGFFTAARPFKYPDGEAHDIEAVAQDILDDLSLEAEIPAVTLDVPTSPDFVITSFKYDVESGMDALQRLIQVIGWDLRYRWKESVSGFRFMLTDPGRTKTTPDRTLAPGQIVKISELKIDRTNLRNIVDVYYGTPSASGARHVEGSRDAASVAKYGARRMVFQESSDSAINTEDEAKAMAAYACADLKEPKATHGAELFYDWTLELHDLVRFTANGNQYDQDQNFGVRTIRHAFTGGDDPQARTVVTCAGGVAGAYRNWIARARGSAPPVPNAADLGLNGFTWEDSADGTQRTFSWTRGAKINAITVYSQELTVPHDGDPFDFGEHGPVAVLLEGEDSFTITKPTTGYQIALRFEPRTTDFTAGVVVKIIVDPKDAWSVSPSTTENTATSTGTVTLAVTDPGAALDQVTPIQFYQKANGATTGPFAPTTSPSSGSNGTFTYVITLAIDHITVVRAVAKLADGTSAVVGEWSFDSDKIANVLSAVPSINNQTATVNCSFDSDTVVSASGARYRIDGGSWASFAVNSSLKGSFTVTLSATAEQVVEVEGLDADGNYGPPIQIKLGTYDAAAGAVSISFDVISGNESGQASASLVVALPANVASFKYIVTTAGDPLDATVRSSGTTSNSRNTTIPAAVAAVNIGDKVYAAVIPYTGSGASGTELPPIHISQTYTKFAKLKTVVVSRSNWKETSAYSTGGVPTSYGISWNIDDPCNPAWTSASRQMTLTIEVPLSPGVKVRQIDVPYIWTTVSNPLAAFDVSVYVNGVQRGSTQGATYGATGTISFIMADILLTGTIKIRVVWGVVASAVDGLQATVRDPVITYLMPSQDNGV